MDSSSHRDEQKRVLKAGIPLLLSPIPSLFSSFPLPFQCLHANYTVDFIPYLVKVCWFFCTVISEGVAVGASDFIIFLKNVEKIHFFEGKIISL